MQGQSGRGYHMVSQAFRQKGGSRSLSGTGRENAGPEKFASDPVGFRFRIQGLS